MPFSADFAVAALPYDFVEGRTHNGKKFCMLNIIDEITRECLAIRIGRKFNSTDIIDALSDLLILRGVPGSALAASFITRTGAHSVSQKA